MNILLTAPSLLSPPSCHPMPTTAASSCRLFCPSPKGPRALPLPSHLPSSPPLPARHQPRQAPCLGLQHPSAISRSPNRLQLRPLCCAYPAPEGPVKFTSCGKSPLARHMAQKSQGEGDSRKQEDRSRARATPGGVREQEEETGLAPPPR